jgi:hypothetical protein
LEAIWLAGQRPADLAAWPIPRRERWGLRANELFESGLRWPMDEIRAFVEVGAEVSAGRVAAKPPGDR